MANVVHMKNSHCTVRVIHTPAPEWLLLSFVVTNQHVAVENSLLFFGKHFLETKDEDVHTKNEKYKNWLVDSCHFFKPYQNVCEIHFWFTQCNQYHPFHVCIDTWIESNVKHRVLLLLVYCCCYCSAPTLTASYCGRRVWFAAHTIIISLIVNADSSVCVQEELRTRMLTFFFSRTLSLSLSFSTDISLWQCVYTDTYVYTCTHWYASKHAYMHCGCVCLCAQYRRMISIRMVWVISGVRLSRSHVVTLLENKCEVE